MDSKESKMGTAANRHYYGFEAAYGLNTTDSHGERLGNFVSFPSASERDAWVADGNPYSTQPAAREAIPASDPEIRRMLSIYGVVDSAYARGED
jgi:hypothetical protein